MGFGVGEQGGLGILITGFGKGKLLAGLRKELRSGSLELEYNCIGYAFGMTWDIQSLFRV